MEQFSQHKQVAVSQLFQGAMIMYHRKQNSKLEKILKVTLIRLMRLIFQAIFKQSIGRILGQIKIQLESHHSKELGI